MCGCMQAHGPCYWGLAPAAQQDAGRAVLAGAVALVLLACMLGSCGMPAVGDRPCAAGCTLPLHTAASALSVFAQVVWHSEVLEAYGNEEDCLGERGGVLSLEPATAAGGPW